MALEASLRGRTAAAGGLTRRARLWLRIHCGNALASYVARPMWSEDDIQYAAENTQVVLAPSHQIATFGATSFRFYLISELMDQVNEVRVRDGHIHAERPQIVTPDHYARLLLEGFGDRAQRYVEQLRERLRNVAARGASSAPNDHWFSAISRAHRHFLSRRFPLPRSFHARASRHLCAHLDWSRDLYV